jgi:hypothetical protein
MEHQQPACLPAGEWGHRDPNSWPASLLSPITRENCIPLGYLKVTICEKRFQRLQGIPTYHRELIPLGFLKVRSRALLIKGCQRRGDIYRSEQQHPRWQAGRVQEIGDTATHTWADPPTPSDVYQGVPRVTPALLTCAFVWPQHFQYQPLHEFSISYGDSETLHMQKVIVLNQSLALTKRWSGRLCDLKSAAHLRTDSSVRKSSSNMSTSAPLELCTSHIPAD